MSFLNSRELQQDATTTGLDANNTASVTNGVDTSQADRAIFYVDANTGTNAAHVLEFQCSYDNTNWHSISGANLTGIGYYAFDCKNFNYLRVKVKTAEGGVSTVDVTIQTFG